MVQVVGIVPQVACDRFQEGACEEVPLINCTNTESPVIYLTDEEGTSVTVDDNCLLIKGSGFELLKAMNRFLYSWFGVMP